MPVPLFPLGGQIDWCDSLKITLCRTSARVSRMRNCAVEKCGKNCAREDQQHWTGRCSLSSWPSSSLLAAGITSAIVEIGGDNFFSSSSSLSSSMTLPVAVRISFGVLLAVVDIKLLEESDHEACSFAKRCLTASSACCHHHSHHSSFLLPSLFLSLSSPFLSLFSLPFFIIFSTTTIQKPITLQH